MGLQVKSNGNGYVCANSPHLRHYRATAPLRRCYTAAYGDEKTTALARAGSSRCVRARKSAAICARLEQVLAEALAGAEGAGTAQVSAEGTSRADATGGSAVPTVAVFASMRSEVDTRPFVEAAYARGWDVCFPCMVREEPAAGGSRAAGRAGADEAGGSPVPSEPRAGDAPRMPSGSRAAGEASERRAAGETGDTSGSPLMRFYRVAREQLDAAAAGFLGAPLRCLACEALERDGFQAVDPEELDAVVVPLVAFDDAGRRLGYGGGNYDQLLPRLRADAAVVGIAFDEQRVKTVPCEPHDIALPRVVSG